MSGLKAIRRRLSSVKNTKQITRAMKLVSAAKLKRAQDAALGGRKFSERLGEVLKTSIKALPQSFTHPLIEVREVKKTAYVVFSGERGLCGAYNSNIFKAISAEVKSRTSEAVCFAVGKRSESSIKRLGLNLSQSFVGLPEDAGLWPMDDLGAKLVAMYSAKEVDEVILIYTKFLSAMNQEIVSAQLLPFALDSDSETVSDAKIEPSAEEVFAEILPLTLKTKLFQAGYESKACEHASRMTAMDSATRNADELMDKLRLFYNRARQRVITAELLDILGGAEAQKS
jgi:F-type H+-transporting ATPase subunit gamma